MAEVRALNEAQVETLVGWAGDEGWNPGLNDAHAFYVADPDGFLGCFENGEMAAGIAAIAYDGQFGFIGLYICRPEFRGRGLGRMVWDAGMIRLGSRTVGLDGVPAQQANYRAMGFEPAYETHRYVGRLAAKDKGEADGWSIEPFRPAMRDAVMVLDRACFLTSRTDFIDHWMREPHRGFVALREGVMGGFCTVRRCRTGCKIGPLFAREFGAAAALLFRLGEAADGDMSIDVPDSQPAFRHMLSRSGMIPSFTTSRMYRGVAPPLRSEWVYGVTTLELG